MKKTLFLLSILLFSISCFSQSRTISETTKKIVFTRDGGVCQCCGSTFNLEYDHITPFSCGGSSTVSNIQLLCKKCNRSKSNSCTCKIHNRRVGTNCCERNASRTRSNKQRTSSTKNHSTSSTQCTGTTKKGARCKKMTTNANGRCYLH